MEKEPRMSKANSTITGLPKAGFMRLQAVLTIYPVSRSTWWSMVKTGLAPKPVKLSRRCAAWKVEDIQALIDSREGE
jgi:prophage regulatory protein